MSRGSSSGGFWICLLPLWMGVFLALDDDPAPEAEKAPDTIEIVSATTPEQALQAGLDKSLVQYFEECQSAYGIGEPLHNTVTEQVANDVMKCMEDARLEAVKKLTPKPLTA